MAIDDDLIEDLPEKLSRKYLPPNLGDRCLVLPKRLFKWACFNVLLIGLGLGFMLGDVLGDILPSGRWLAIAIAVIYGICRIIAKTVLEPEEEKFLERANRAEEET